MPDGLSLVGAEAVPDGVPELGAGAKTSFVGVAHALSYVELDPFRDKVSGREGGGPRGRLVDVDRRAEDWVCRVGSLPCLC